MLQSNGNLHKDTVKNKTQSQDHLLLYSLRHFWKKYCSLSHIVFHKDVFLTGVEILQSPMAVYGINIRLS